MFELDQVGLFLPVAHKIIQAERETYNEVYDIIENYIAEFGPQQKTASPEEAIIVGGDISLKILTSKKEREDYTYEIYSEKALWHANNLANTLSQVLDAKTTQDHLTNRVVMKTSLANNKFQIVIDLRPMVIIYALETIRGKSAALPLIVPPEMEYLSHRIYVLSPEIHLIDVYRTLYSPQAAGDWETVAPIEKELFRQLQERLPVLGGAHTSPAPSDAHFTIEERQTLISELYSEFVCNNTNLALLGEHAWDKLNGGEPDFTANLVLQIISFREAEEDLRDITRLVQKVLRREVNVTKNTRGLHIMQDFRITRTTIKIDNGTESKDIMYIYNSANYELIPLHIMPKKDKRKGVQIAHITVLLRFALIDVWILRWIQQQGAVDETFAQQRLQALWQRYLQLHKYYIDNPQPLPTQAEYYLGVFEDETVAQKIYARESRKYFDYLPREYFQQNGQYRQIGAAPVGEE